MTGYEILRALDGGEMTALVADTQSNSVAYIDEAAESGRTHAYQVVTIMGEQKSEASNRVEVHVPHDPVDLAPSNVEAVAIQGGVGLDWDAPEADAESITGYRILRSSSPEVVLVKDTKSDVTEFIDDTVYDQGLYTYRIEGLRGNVKSDSSNSRTILFVDNEPVAAPQVSGEERRLVRNTSIFTPDHFFILAAQSVAQEFTAGTHTAGYVLTSIGARATIILNTSTAGSELTATLNEASGAIPGAVLCTLTDPATFTTIGLQTFTAPTTGESACPTLIPTRTYFFVIERTSGTGNVGWTVGARDDEDPGSARDWSIANGRQLFSSGTWDPGPESLLIEVRGAKLVGNGELQVKNTDQTADSAAHPLNATQPTAAQPFKTGGNDGAYTLSSIGVMFDDVDDFAHAEDELTATLNEIGSGQPADTICTLINPAYIQKESLNIFRASPVCPTLEADTHYFFVLERTGFDAGDIKLDRASGDHEDSGAAPGWSIHDLSYNFANGSWGDDTSSLLIEVWADEYFPISQLRWAGEITPACSPVFGSCGHFTSRGRAIDNIRRISDSASFEVKQLTWWADDSFGYVKLVMTAYDEDKNREAATAGKFPELDYLRVAWGKAARDDPYHPDFKFGPDETELNPFGTSGAGGRYNSVNNDVTFLWKISKSDYSNRGLKFAGNHYPIYVQLRK